MLRCHPKERCNLTALVRRAPVPPTSCPLTTAVQRDGAVRPDRLLADDFCPPGGAAPPDGVCTGGVCTRTTPPPAPAPGEVGGE